jgi:hypothetical protein
MDFNGQTKITVALTATQESKLLKAIANGQYTQKVCQLDADGGVWAEWELVPVVAALQLDAWCPQCIKRATIVASDSTALAAAVIALYPEELHLEDLIGSQLTKEANNEVEGDN